MNLKYILDDQHIVIRTLSHTLLNRTRSLRGVLISITLLRHSKLHKRKQGSTMKISLSALTVAFSATATGAFVPRPIGMPTGMQAAHYSIKNHNPSKLHVSTSTDVDYQTKSDNVDNLSDATKTRTQRIMEKTPVEGQTGGAGGVSTWDAFVRAESNWRRLRDAEAFKYDAELGGTQNGIPPPVPFVTSDGGQGNQKAWEVLREQADHPNKDFDVIICGGTLGIFIALSLQLKGLDVCVVEGGKLQGREQEWNISMDEMLELVELGVLTQSDLDEAIKTEFPVCRSGFKNQEGEFEKVYNHANTV